MHEPTVAYGSKQKWQLEIVAKNAGAEVAIGEGDREARTKGDVIIYAAIFAQSDFAFGSAVKIVENRPGQTTFG
jgi:hypothetical protein